MPRRRIRPYEPRRPPMIEPLEPRCLPAGQPVLVRDINPGTGDADPRELTDVNGTLFFTANNGRHGIEL